MFIKQKNNSLSFKNALDFAMDIIQSNKAISLQSPEHPIYKVIQILARSIQAKHLQYIITTPEFEIPNRNDITLFIPNYHLAKDKGIPTDLYSEMYIDEVTTLDFSKDVAFTFPWAPRRFKSVASGIKREEWEYDKINHQAQFYEPFKIGVITNGYHSSTIGILNNQGILPASIIDLSGFYDWVYTDGELYYNAKNGEKICEVNSFEEAVIFEIGRLIHNSSVSEEN